MAKTKVKARVSTADGGGEFEAVIYAAGLWRVIGTPHSKAKDMVKPYKTKTAAKRGAEKTAAALGITLEWVD